MPRRKLEYKDIFKTREMVEYYADHPCEFIEDIIFNKNAKKYGGSLEISWQQKEIIESVAKNKRTSVASGVGIGKTATAAWLSIWFISIFRTPKIVVSSPSKSQLYTALWPEISVWLKMSLVNNLFEKTATKLFLKTDPNTWTCVPKTVSKGSEEAASGLHTENLLIICDEPAAMSDAVLDKYDATLTEQNNHLLLIGNPTRTDGFFFNTHNKYKKFWKCFQFSAEDSPRCDKEEVRIKEERYGRDHDIFQVSVLGNFPKGTSNSFLSLYEVEEAVNRDQNLEGEIEIGVDVARFGDDLTVICSRKGYTVFPFDTRAKSSIPETVAAVLEKVKSLRMQYGYKEKIRIKVDDTGVGCLTQNTEVLTVDGWKRAKDITPGTSIYSKNKDGIGTIEKVKDNILREPTKVLSCGGFEFAWSHLIPYKTRMEHNWILNDWKSILERKTIAFDTAWKWCEETKDMIIPMHTIIMPYGGTRKYKDEIKVEAKIFARFLGWFLSEGSFDRDGIKITQVKKTHLKEIESVLDSIGSWKRKKNDYVIFNKELTDWLRRECYVPGTERGAYRKKVPLWLKLNSIEVISEFLDAFRKGDGYMHHGVASYVTTSTHLSDDILECIYKTGKYANKTIKAKAGSKGCIFGREFTRIKDVFVIYELQQSVEWLTPLQYGVSVRTEPVNYITITGETRLFFTRCPGSTRAFWTHNGGVTDLLNLDRDNDVEVVPCSFGGKGSDTYFNEASIMWGNVKENIGKISLPRDRNLMEELSTRRWTMTDNSKIKIEPKREFKDNYGSSPDRADALVLCFARKQSERVILQDFDFLDPTVVRAVPAYVSGERYATVFYSRGNTYSLIMANWSGNKLYITNDYESDDSMYNVASELRRYGKVERTIGNDVMFKKFGEDIRSQFASVGIFVNDNYRYDEPGAIEILKRMIKTKRIVIDPHCVKTIDQFRKWGFDGARSQVESNYGMCFAILNLISELKEKIEYVVRPPEYVPYNADREKSMVSLTSPLKKKFNRWQLM